MAINTDKVKSAIAEGGKSLASGASFLLMFGALPKEKTDALILSIHQATDASVQLVGAVGNMWIIIGPLIVAALIRMGWTSADPKALATRLLNQATQQNDGAAEAAKVALVSAAASPSIGSTGIINPALAANPGTPGNVVASAASLPPH